MALKGDYKSESQDLAARADSAHLHTLIHGQDTRNLAQSLEQVSHHTGALKRMISPLSLMEPVGAGQDHQNAEQLNKSKVGSFAGALASALINHMLMFGMCCSYGMIIFSEERNAAHRALGVKMCLAASFIGGGLMSVISGIPVAIGGTDLNPAVFYGDWVITISDELTKSLVLGDYASYSSSSGRLLKKNDPTKYFCKGDHLLANPQECESYHAQLRATTIFAVAFSTLLLAIIWSVLGKLKLTRYVSYMPYSISEAFLACVGYKVFFYAIKFCDFDPRQFFTAAFIGIALYFCKALHIGNPTIMMPLGLLLPLAIFWGIVVATDQTPADVRDAGWLFPEVKNEPFYLVWLDSLGSVANINFSAWVATLPNLAVMLVVSTMDCVLKLHATESKLPLKVSTDDEALKFGIFNYLLACFGSATGYMQLKFNVISYGVMRNAHDRRAGMIYALFCGAAYFSTVEHFNYLPKLFLSALLFFAGAGFVTDNMWGSRKFLHFSEWLEIVVILIVFIAAGQLIWAVVAGLVLSGLAFIAKYARVPSMDGKPKRGDQVTTRERPVGEVGHQSFMHIASAWILIVNLKGYVFFSSCVAVMRSVETYFQKEDENKVPAYRRLKFLIFDGSALDGMDASGAMSMAKLTRKAKQRGIRVIWCDIKDDLAEELRVRHILQSMEDRFEDLDNAMTHLEKRILKYKMNQQDEWLNLHPAFRRDRALMLQRVNFEPFREVFLSDGARMGCPWRYCSRLPIKGFKTMLCVPGDQHRPLYLIHSGAIAILDEVPDSDQILDAHASWKKPRVILRQGWFVNEKTIFGQPSSSYALAVEDGEVLFWTEEQWWKMTNEHPLMMMEISKAVMRQQGEHHFHRDPEKLRRPSELSMDDIDTEGLMRREVSASEIEAVAEEEDSEEEELMIPDENPEDELLPPTTYTSNASIGSYVYQSKGVTRFNKSVLCTPIDLGETFEREELKKLPQLQTRIMEVHFARALGEQGFFRKTGDPGYLPDLPKILSEDLRLAYFTFAEKTDTTGDSQGKIIVPASRVIDALMYVGIFHILPEEVNQKDVTLDEFLALGRECHLARLLPEQMQKIEDLCVDHEHMVNGEMQLRVADVSHMLKMLFGIYLDFAINDAVTSAWGQETWPDTHVTHKQFAGIVSWYVKRRERDWRLLQGVFDLMGKENLVGSLNKDLLEDCRARHSDDTGGDTTPHEEMLWAADWIRRGEGKGTHLDTCSLLTVFLTNLQRGKGRLPPKSAMSEQEVRPKRAWDRHAQRALKKKGTQSLVSNIQSTKKMLLQEGSTDGEEPAWAQKIIDLLERPQASTCAAICVYTMLALTVLNVVAIVAEPMISGLEEDQTPDEHLLWLGCDIFFAAIFTIELVLRVLARCALKPGWKTLVHFFSHPFNIFDLVAVTEIYFDHLIHLPVLRMLILERFARLSRVMKLCKLSAYGCPMVAPLTAVLVVIFGTYMLHLEEIISS